MTLVVKRVPLYLEWNPLIVVQCQKYRKFFIQKNMNIKNTVVVLQSKTTRLSVIFQLD